MKKFWKDFFMRGSSAAWCGPVSVCLVWVCLDAAGVLGPMDIATVTKGVISGTVIAFIAAGITAIHQLEQLPRGIAILIHAAVLYLDYLIIYLLNNWLSVSRIWIFTLCFAAGFALIWVIIFAVNRKAVNRMNAKIVAAEND